MTTLNKLLLFVLPMPCDMDLVDMDVGDGCHGDYSTLIGTRVAFGEFREAMLAARIQDRPTSPGVYHAIPYLVPARMSPDR